MRVKTEKSLFLLAKLNKKTLFIRFLVTDRQAKG